jgi:uncharacterized membrane protein
MQRSIYKNTEERINRIIHQYEEQILTHINQDYTRHTRRSDRIADKIAQVGDSRIHYHLSRFLTAWMVWNTLTLTKSLHFDPAPFILLNLILSFTAAFQLPLS